METLATLGLALGSAWASGIRLYATVAVLGLLGRYTAVQLPGQLQVLTTDAVILTALALTLVELVADKVAYIDSIWDAIQTFIRVPAGALLAWGAFSTVDPGWQVAAALLGGSFALTSHGTKATLRAAVNTSPEPFSNVAVSTAEDGVAAGGALLAVFAPIVMLVLSAVAVVAAWWVVPKVWRKLRGIFRGSEAPTPPAP